MRPDDTGDGFSSAHEPGSPEGLGASEVDARSELAKWISGTHAFPAGKEDLLDRAATESAPGTVLDALRSLPDRTYENMEEVAEQLGLGGHGFHA